MEFAAVRADRRGVVRETAVHPALVGARPDGGNVDSTWCADVDGVPAASEDQKGIRVERSESTKGREGAAVARVRRRRQQQHISRSGREHAEKGHPERVAIAAAVDSSPCVPTLRGASFTRAADAAG